MKKVLSVLAVVAVAAVIVSFTTRSATHAQHPKGKKLDYQLFQFTGDFGEEDDYTKYDWVENAPTGCSESGSVCYIEALRASDNDEDEDYLHPQFNVSGGFPEVDMIKVTSLTEKAGPAH